MSTYSQDETYEQKAEFDQLPSRSGIHDALASTPNNERRVISLQPLLITNYLHTSSGEVTVANERVVSQATTSRRSS